jgi:hypothetical protein
MPGCSLIAVVHWEMIVPLAHRCAALCDEQTLVYLVSESFDVFSAKHLVYRPIVEESSKLLLGHRLLLGDVCRSQLNELRNKRHGLLAEDAALCCTAMVELVSMKNIIDDQ